MSSKEQAHQNEKAGLRQRSPQSGVQTQPSQLIAFGQQAKFDPRSATVNGIVQLQRMIGNQAVGQLLVRTGSPQVMQPKLKASPDKQEAKQAAISSLPAISPPVAVEEAAERIQPQQRQAQSKKQLLPTKFLPAVAQLEAMPTDNDLLTEPALPVDVEKSKIQKLQQPALQHAVQLKPEVAYINRGSKGRAILHLGEDWNKEVEIPHHTRILVDYDRMKKRNLSNYVWAQSEKGDGYINRKHVLAPMHDFEERIASITKLKQLFELFQEVGAEDVAKSHSGGKEAKDLFKDLSSCSGTAEMVTKYFVLKGREHQGKDALNEEAKSIAQIPVNKITFAPKGDPLDNKHVDKFIRDLQTEPLSIAYITTDGGSAHYFSIVRSGEKYALYQGWAEKYTISRQINNKLAEDKDKGKKSPAPKTDMNTTNMDSEGLKRLLTAITKEGAGSSEVSEGIFGARTGTDKYIYHTEGIKEAKGKD